jgi:hypothetical protein
MNPKDNLYQEQLERVIHSELKKLPDLQPPPTLIQNVLKELELRAHRPWWRKPFLLWPRGIQTIFVMCTLSLVAGSVYGASAVGDWVGNHPVLPFVGRMATLVLDNSILLVMALVDYVASLGSWWWLAALAAVSCMYISCLGVGLAFLKVISPQRETQDFA